MNSMASTPVRCSLLALLLLVCSCAGTPEQTTYYIGPDGSDGNSGRSAAQPLGSFEAAVDKLSPGDSLIVLDGIYEQGAKAGQLLLENVHGTEERPIVIKADNERRAWLQGTGLDSPVSIQESSWLVIDGLRASSRDNSNDAEDGSAVTAVRSHHLVLRRLLTHNANRYENASVIGGSQCHHILVEECEAYNFHRHGISFHRGDQITIRRRFVHARNARTPEESRFYEGHGCCREAGDEGYSFYFTSNSILENSISMHSEQLSVIGGVGTVLGNPGGQNNRTLGNISYKDLRPGGFLQSRQFLHDAKDRYGGFTDAADSIQYKDFLIVGGQDLDRGGNFFWNVARNATLEGATIINVRRPRLGANASSRRGGPDDNSVFMGCQHDDVGGCRYRVRNALFENNAHTDEGPLLYASPPEMELDFLLEYSNAWNNDEPGKGFAVSEDAGDDEGRYRHAMSVRPERMGLGEGECIVFVPETANMSQAGADVDGDGMPDDIGANILYRYRDGELTDEPLWDAETGVFPHGAVIEGSPNNPAQHEVVLANIHEHLNVNTNGCELPYPVN
jgi:hypothetical protein